MKVEQLTLLGHFGPAEPQVGEWLNGEEIDLFKGDVIPFQDLHGYIDQKIVVEYLRASFDGEFIHSYKVVKVTGYYKDHDNVYRWNEHKEAVLDSICDRVGYSDDKRTGKENSWVSEMHCSNGRYDGGYFPICMYRLNV